MICAGSCASGSASGPTHEEGNVTSGEGELVFVYGTLRAGASNHHRMSGAEPVGRATVRGRLYRIDWYPGLVIDPAGEVVTGEVYRVTGELLATLDDFEGGEYGRVRAAVEGLEKVEAVWVWEYRPRTDEAQRISGGDWLEQD